MSERATKPTQTSKLPLDVPSETALTGLPTVGDGAANSAFTVEAAPEPDAVARTKVRRHSSPQN